MSRSLIETFAPYIFLLLGMFLAANLSFLRKLLSLEELFLGFQRGLHIGDKWKKGEEKREAKRKEGEGRRRK